MNARKQKKNTDKIQLSNFKEKIMALQLLEFLEKFMVDSFLIKLTQFEKTGSTVKFLFRWEIRLLNSTFETIGRSRFSRPLHFRCSIVEFAFSITRKLNQF